MGDFNSLFYTFVFVIFSLFVEVLYFVVILDVCLNTKLEDTFYMFLHVLDNGFEDIGIIFCLSFSDLSCAL